MEYEERTRLPTALDDEDPFLSLAEIKLSLRQMLTIMFGLFAWWACAKLTQVVLGFLAFGVSGILAALLWSWLMPAALYAAFRKIDGRPYEEYLSYKILFLISPRRFGLKDPNVSKDMNLIEDADWDNVASPFS